MASLLQPTRERSYDMYRPVSIYNLSDDTLKFRHDDEEYIIPPGKKYGVPAMVAWQIFGDPHWRDEEAPKQWEREVARIRFQRTIDPKLGVLDDFFQKYIKTGIFFCKEICYPFAPGADGKLRHDPSVTDRFYGRLGVDVKRTHTASEPILAGELEQPLAPQGLLQECTDAEIEAYLMGKVSSGVKKGSAVGPTANLHKNTAPQINEWGNDDSVPVYAEELGSTAEVFHGTVNMGH